MPLRLARKRPPRALLVGFFGLGRAVIVSLSILSPLRSFRKIKVKNGETPAKLLRSLLTKLHELRSLRTAQIADAGSDPKRAHTKVRERGTRPRTMRWVVLSGALVFLLSLPAAASVVQQGNLRITLLSQVQPYKLPRIGTSPIAVFLAGRIAAPTGGVPSQLQRLSIKVNRHARFQSQGLPKCPLAAIQPATTQQALANCGPALVGSGQFWAQIVFAEQGAYSTHGRLLVFNGTHHGHPALLAQIYNSNPFSSSFVIPFEIRQLHSGTYGTEFTASLPEALGKWGYVDRIKLTLKRKYSWHGRHLSYFNAGCPAIPGTKRTSYYLADATFSFAGHKSIELQVPKTCGVKE
jgi:hypothetical protein